MVPFFSLHNKDIDGEGKVLSNKEYACSEVQQSSKVKQTISKEYGR